MSVSERRQLARIAAHVSWANTDDPTARTAPGREAFLNRFERAVDPNGELSPEVRARKAEHAFKAHMASLSLKSARARAAKKAGPA